MPISWQDGKLSGMSYDLAVWEGAQPGDDVEAGTVYEQLYEEYR